MDVEIKLLQNWSYGGTDFRAGERLKIDKAIADLLVNTSVAEMVTTGATGDGESEAQSKPTKAATTEPAETLTLDDVRTVVTAALREETAKATQSVKGPGVQVIKERVMDDPSRGFKTPREFISEVMDACQRGLPDSGMSDGLKALRMHTKAQSTDEAMVASDPYGGFLVPVTFTPDMLRIEPEKDPMAGRTTMIPMVTPTIKMPARVDKDHSTSVSGGLTVARSMETITKTATRMVVEQVTLTAHSLFGLSFATEELLADSPISFAAILAAGFSDQFTYHMINERLNGTGVGEYMGIMNSPCLVSIAKESEQPATTIRFPNIVKMRARAWGYQDAIWMANHDCIPQLMQMNVEVGVGGAPVWQPSAVPDHPDMLLGRPIIFTEYAKTLGAVGDIVLANWKEFLEGVLQPLQSAESIHVRFDAHERAFKFWLRNAGAPWWRSALTPKNSTDTLSPFVVLAVRA